MLLLLQEINSTRRWLGVISGVTTLRLFWDQRVKQTFPCLLSLVNMPGIRLLITRGSTCDISFGFIGGIWRQRDVSLLCFLWNIFLGVPLKSREFLILRDKILHFAKLKYSYNCAEPTPQTPPPYCVGVRWQSSSFIIVYFNNNKKAATLSMLLSNQVTVSRGSSIGLAKAELLSTWPVGVWVHWLGLDLCSSPHSQPSGGGC